MHLLHCNVRVPKSRPILTCTICNLPKHYKCEGLSKAIASEILQHNNESYHWACHGCFILPTYNYIDDPRPTYFNHPKSLMLCDPVCKICLNSCSSFLNNYAKCIWCDKICHKKCINGQLGCLPCCIELIPGFQCNSIFYGSSSIIIRQTPGSNSSG